MDSELKDYLDRQAKELARQLKEFQDETRQEFAKNREFQDETRQELKEIRDDVRRTRVLVEKLDDKIDLVAEGVESNTQVMHRLHDEQRREHRDHKLLITAISRVGFPSRISRSASFGLRESLPETRLREM